jgi:hypothetical protein
MQAAAGEAKAKAAAKPGARPATTAAGAAKKGLATEVSEPTFPEMSLGEVRKYHRVCVCVFVCVFP